MWSPLPCHPKSSSKLARDEQEQPLTSEEWAIDGLDKSRMVDTQFNTRTSVIENPELRSAGLQEKKPANLL
jgi:hypothetical protein